jgi:ABC-type amino acid transport substrate-binding protein
MKVMPARTYGNENLSFRCYGDYGFIFKQGSDLVAAFNAAPKAMKDDGTLHKLTTKWFTPQGGKKGGFCSSAPPG